MASDCIQKILKGVRGLPPLPAAVQRLCEMADDPDARLQEMADIILSDQSLTARVLRVANSAFYGFSGRIGTVNQAIVLLGFHAIRNMALSLSLMSVRVGGHTRVALDSTDLWRHSLATACAARRIAADQGTSDPEEAFVAGLLHDIGKIVLSGFCPEEYASILERVANGDGMLAELERDLFEVDHAIVGRELCAHWKLPQALSAVVAGHHDVMESGESGSREADLLRAVRLGNALSRIAGIGSGGDPFIGDEVWRLVEATPHRGTALDPILGTLVVEAQAIESAFGLSPSREATDTAWPDGPPIVGIQLREPRCRELVRMTLLALGARPAIVQLGQAPSGDLAALVFERVAPERDDDSSSTPCPVALDLGAWIDARPAPGATGLHVDDLRSWLATGLRSADGAMAC